MTDTTLTMTVEPTTDPRFPVFRYTTADGRSYARQIVEHEAELFETRGGWTQDERFAWFDGQARAMLFPPR